MNCLRFLARLKRKTLTSMPIPAPTKTALMIDPASVMVDAAAEAVSAEAEPNNRP